MQNPARDSEAASSEIGSDLRSNSNANTLQQSPTVTTQVKYYYLQLSMICLEATLIISNVMKSNH